MWRAVQGKAMAYAALGRVRRNWLHLFEVIYKEYARSTVTIQQFPIANLKRALGLSMGEAIKTQDAKDIAATSQVPRSIRRLCSVAPLALRSVPDRRPPITAALGMACAAPIAGGV